MVSIPSLCKSQELVISAFKTRRKLEVSEDVIQSLQIVNTSNMRHIDHDCLINSLSSEIKTNFYLRRSLVQESTVNLTKVYLIMPGTNL